MQPELFPVEEIINREIVDRAAAAKRLIAMLSAFRRKTAEVGGGQFFVSDITRWLNETRAKGKATPTQIEGVILYAIEKQQCWTLTEICEETGLDRKVANDKINEMQKSGLVKIVRRHVPGMFKKTYLIKSNRQNEPEAE